jgi:hypothetical protein
MGAAYVLIMVLGVYNSHSVVVKQEFTSQTACEAARKELEKSHNPRMPFLVQTQGCFKL